MSQYDDLLRALSPNNKELRAIFESLQADLRAMQTVIDLSFGPYYDDLRIPFTQTKQGSNLKPDFDATNIGYLFPQNDAAEKLYFVAQIPHSWKTGTNLLPHIHWRQSAATAVTWKVDLQIVPRNTLEATFTTYSAAVGVFPYTSGSLNQISKFPEIDMSAITESSALVLGRVYRDDNTTTGDVLAWEFDFHFESDTPGSRTEFTK